MMMKKILLAIGLMFFLVSGLLAQQQMPVDIKTGKITYIEVVDATGLTAKELYEIMKEWANKQGFKIKEEKEAEGEMVFESSIPVEYARVKGKNEMSKVSFTTYLMAKDNKYRFIFTDFIHTGSDKSLSGGKMENVTPECGYSGINAGNWNLIKKAANSDMEAKINELKKAIKEAQNDPTRNKDW